MDTLAQVEQGKFIEVRWPDDLILLAVRGAETLRLLLTASMKAANCAPTRWVAKMLRRYFSRISSQKDCHHPQLYCAQDT